MKKLTSVKFVAESGGLFQVFRSGQPISEHTGERNAVARCVSEQAEFPDADVWYEQHLVVRCNPRFKAVEQEMEEVTVFTAHQSQPEEFNID